MPPDQVPLSSTHTHLWALCVRKGDSVRMCGGGGGGGGGRGGGEGVRMGTCVWVDMCV